MRDIYINALGCWFDDEDEYILPKHTLLSVGGNVDMEDGEIHALLCIYRPNGEITHELWLTEAQALDLSNRLRESFTHKEEVRREIAALVSTPCEV